MRLLRILVDEAWTTLRRPQRLLRALQPSRIRRFLRFQSARMKSREKWVPDRRDSPLARRQVASYEDYLFLQAAKLERMHLGSYERKFRRVLGERIGRLDFVRHGCTVLCLGARLGAEVRAFRDHGCFAVGVDLNPGECNDSVLYGDFQQLRLPDRCVDIIYTNSVDHSFDFSGMISEMCRVLKPDGHVIVEAEPGTHDEAGLQPDMWATFRWERVDDLVTRIEDLGLALVSRAAFDSPRPGVQLVLRAKRSLRPDSVVH